MHSFSPLCSTINYHQYNNCHYSILITKCLDANKMHCQQANIEQTGTASQQHPASSPPNAEQKCRCRCRCRRHTRRNKKVDARHTLIPRNALKAPCVGENASKRSVYASTQKRNVSMHAEQKALHAMSIQQTGMQTMIQEGDCALNFQQPRTEL